jgi:hypothetical protein
MPSNDVFSCAGHSASSNNSTSNQILDPSTYQPVNPAWLKAAALGDELPIRPPAPPMLQQFHVGENSGLLFTG